MTNNKLSIGIINLAVSNILSVYEGCKNAGYNVEVVDIKKNKFFYDILVIPGVGSFGAGMNFFYKNNFDKKIQDYLQRPNSFVYGICLGMQLLFEKSYEFQKNKGLSLINGEVKKFKSSKFHKTHLGWNNISLEKNNFEKYFKKFENKNFYFVHSFFTNPTNKKEVFATTCHGNQKFCSIIKKNNIFGTQFHPEKSGLIGIEFLKNLKYLKN